MARRRCSLSDTGCEWGEGFGTTWKETRRSRTSCISRTPSGVGDPLRRRMRRRGPCLILSCGSDCPQPPAPLDRPSCSTDVTGQFPQFEPVPQDGTASTGSAVRPARSSASAPPSSALRPAPTPLARRTALRYWRAGRGSGRLMFLGELPPAAFWRTPQARHPQLPLLGAHLVRMKLMPCRDRPHAVALLEASSATRAFELNSAVNRRLFPAISLPPAP